MNNITNNRSQVICRYEITSDYKNFVIVVKHLFCEVMLTDCVVTQKPFSLYGEGSSYQKTDKQDHSPLALHNPNIMEYAARNITCLPEERR